MTKAQGTALDRIDQAAKANGWDLTQDVETGNVRLKKRGRGYLDVEFDGACRVVSSGSTTGKRRSSAGM
jgi:hypothetical protein